MGQAAESQVGQTTKRRLRKSQDGIVVSDKMTKTIIVAVARQVQHKSYGKIIRKTRKYYAHDERGEAKVGDLVRIVESRPLSRLKHWRLQTVLRKAV